MKYSEETEAKIREKLLDLQAVAQVPLQLRRSNQLSYAEVATIITNQLALKPPLSITDVRRRYAHIISGTPLKRNRKSVS